jgi:hypothetical protein
MENHTAAIKQILNRNNVSKRLFDAELAVAERLFDQRKQEAALAIAVQLATYAWFNFTTYYTSYRLENLVLKIGKETVTGNPERATREKAGRRILHVATELYELGGHTPLLLKWIQRDQSSEHRIFLTRQSIVDIPLKNFERHHIHPDCIIGSTETLEPLCAVATRLLEAAAGYDEVVLHIHPDDVVPLLAFAKFKPCPVFLMNHADHCFWLGASIIDGIIQLRKGSIALDNKRRQLRDIPQFVLGIPVDSGRNISMKPNEVISKYAIPESSGMRLLTTSTHLKLEPFIGYNYFDAIIPVLERHPDSVLLIVGVEPQNELALTYAHPQIKYLGPLFPEQLMEVESVIDLYIETIPFSSFTALLQVLLNQKPVHFMYAPPAIFRLFEEEGLYSETRAQWQEKLSALLSQKEFYETYCRHTVKLAVSEYSIDTWFAQLRNFYAWADGLKEIKPARIYQDRSFNSSLDEIFLYSISLKRIYEYLFLDEQGKWVLFKRILNYLTLQIRFGKNRSLVLSHGFSYIITYLMRLKKPE